MLITPSHGYRSLFICLFLAVLARSTVVLPKGLFRRTHVLYSASRYSASMEVVNGMFGIWWKTDSVDSVTWTQMISGGREHCSVITPDFAEPDTLIVLALEGFLSPCQFRTKATVIQLLSYHGYAVVSIGHSEYAVSTSGRVYASDATTIEWLVESAVHKNLMHRLSHNKVDLKTLINSNEHGGGYANWGFYSVLIAAGYLASRYLSSDGRSKANPRERLQLHPIAPVNKLDPRKSLAHRIRPVTSTEFRRYMDTLVELAVDYIENPHVYSVTTDQRPGFIYKSLPPHPPDNPEGLDALLKDIYEKILPGATHWQHPQFHAYFPVGCSYPDILADTLISSLGIVGFSWVSSPSFIELEIAMMNWMASAFALPEMFYYKGDAYSSPGGGAIQPSASDAIFVALMAARMKKIREYVPRGAHDRYVKEVSVLGRLVAYASPEAHSSVEKAAMMAMVRLRPLPTDIKFSMRGERLEREVQKDLERGLIPFFVHGTVGSTASTAIDNIDELADVCKKYNMWMHVDGAYAGCAMVCPEFRHLFKGLEKADSLNVNLHKWLLLSAPVSLLWCKQQEAMREAFTVNPVYLKPKDTAETDFRHWGISLSRRAKCFKVWFLLRLFGVKTLRSYIRQFVRLAKRFRDHISNDHRLEIVGEQVLALVCFRVKATSPMEANLLTVQLCEHINRSRKMLVTHAAPSKIDVIRVSVNAPFSTTSDIDESWTIMKGLIDEFFNHEDQDNSLHNQFNADQPMVASPPVTTNSTLSDSSPRSFSDFPIHELTGKDSLRAHNDPDEDTLKSVDELPTTKSATTVTEASTKTAKSLKMSSSKFKKKSRRG